MSEEAPKSTTKKKLRHKQCPPPPLLSPTATVPTTNSVFPASHTTVVPSAGHRPVAKHPFRFAKVQTCPNIYVTEVWDEPPRGAALSATSSIISVCSGHDLASGELSPCSSVARPSTSSSGSNGVNLSPSRQQQCQNSVGTPAITSWAWQNGTEMVSSAVQASAAVISFGAALIPSGLSGLMPDVPTLALPEWLSWRKKRNNDDENAGK